MSKRLSPESRARKLAREKEKRRLAREARGFTSAAEFRRFAAAQAVKTRLARQAKRPILIEPSTERRQRAIVNTEPGESIESFLARGGQIEVVAGYLGPNLSAGIPARQVMAAGARSL